MRKEELFLRGIIIEYKEESDTVIIAYNGLISGKTELELYKSSDANKYIFDYKEVEIKIEGLYPATFITCYSGKKDWSKYITIFNDEKNKYGQYISSILATDVIAEGINLAFVRQVNILNPYWNKVKTNQVVGRATRMKSHLILQPHQKHVEVFHHLMEFTPEQIKIQIDNRILVMDNTLTTDQYLYNVGLIKENLINQFLKILKEVSIDCSFNQSGDFMKKDPTIQCISHLNERIFGYRYDIFTSNLNNLIIDDNNSFLGMPTRTTFIDCELNKYFLQDDTSFHIFNDSKFYYNFYRFIFNTRHKFTQKDIINIPKLGFMKSEINISEMVIPNYELKLWGWLDLMISETIDTLTDIECGDIELMTKYVYKLLCNFNNPMIDDHVCNVFKLNTKSSKSYNEPLVDDLLESKKELDNKSSLCNIIKYEVIGKLYELINRNLYTILEIDNLDLILDVLTDYRETDEYYNILLKLFSNNFDNEEVSAVEVAEGAAVEVAEGAAEGAAVEVAEV